MPGSWTAVAPAGLTTLPRMIDRAENERDEATIDRRRVLASIGAAGAAIGASGAAAGATPALDEARVDAVREPYRDLETVRSVLREETDLLEAVAAAGHIAEPTVDALGVKTLGEPDSVADGHVDIGVSRTSDGLVADIRVVRERESGLVHVSVKPDRDEAFALFEPAAGESVDELYAANLCDCASNEECVRVCRDCTGRKVTCYCDPPGVAPEGVYDYECQCDYNCGGW